MFLLVRFLNFFPIKSVIKNRPCVVKINFFAEGGGRCRPAKYRLAPAAVAFAVLSALQQSFAAPDMAAAAADAAGGNRPYLRGGSSLDPPSGVRNLKSTRPSSGQANLA
jgi:hypothetical protein